MTALADTIAQIGCAGVPGAVLEKDGVAGVQQRLNFGRRIHQTLRYIDLAL